MQSWQQLIESQKKQDYFINLLTQVKAERASGKQIYPPANEVFRAFTLTPLEQVRVVILGQDPYHGPGQANGLAFSVNPHVAFPPSLQNIFKELSNDIADFQIPMHGDLTPWAEQGVFLLNTVLTVQQGQAHSHADWGWEIFTDKVIETLNEHCEHVVFMLWGAHAQKKGRYIDTTKHLVLRAPHPSPLSAYRGFFGSGHFSKANHYLLAHNRKAINWYL